MFVVLKVFINLVKSSMKGHLGPSQSSSGLKSFVLILLPACWNDWTVFSALPLSLPCLSLLIPHLVRPKVARQQLSVLNPLSTHWNIYQKLPSSSVNLCVALSFHPLVQHLEGCFCFSLLSQPFYFSSNQFHSMSVTDMTITKVAVLALQKYASF